MKQTVISEVFFYNIYIYIFFFAVNIGLKYKSYVWKKIILFLWEEPEK